MTHPEATRLREQTLTPGPRRRAVEVMMDAISNEVLKYRSGANKNLTSQMFAEAALTALLTVADVTMKENEGG